jgi:hypothetical protein
VQAIIHARASLSTRPREAVSIKAGRNDEEEEAAPLVVALCPGVAEEDPLELVEVPLPLLLLLDEVPVEVVLAGRAASRPVTKRYSWVFGSAIMR